MEKIFPIVRSHSNNGGFTIVELLIVIIVAGILLSIGIESTVAYQTNARDAERIADTDVIMRNIERYYREQVDVAGASYPVTTLGAAALVTYMANNDVVVAPGETSTSLTIAGSSSAQTPTVSEYIYQPLNLDGSLCTTSPCVRFKLYYRLEATNTVITRNSLRQQ